MNPAPARNSPRPPPFFCPRKMASSVEVGPGKRLAAPSNSANSASVTQRRSTTNVRCMSAMCAAGPPKAVAPRRRKITKISRRSNLQSLGERCENPLGIDPPDIPRVDVREPDPAEAGPDRISSLAVELLRDLVGRWVNPSDRVLERRHPHGPFAGGDLPAAARN